MISAVKYGLTLEGRNKGDFTSDIFQESWVRPFLLGRAQYEQVWVSRTANFVHFPTQAVPPVHLSSPGLAAIHYRLGSAKHVTNRCSCCIKHRHDMLQLRDRSNLRGLVIDVTSACGQRDTRDSMLSADSHPRTCIESKYHRKACGPQPNVRIYFIHCNVIFHHGRFHRMVVLREHQKSTGSTLFFTNILIVL